MKNRTTTAIVYSGGNSAFLESNISQLQGWVSEIVVMYFGQDGSMLDKIRGINGVRVHRTLWRGSLSALRNESRSISRGDFHIHLNESECIADRTLWAHFHDSLATMSNSDIGRLPIKKSDSSHLHWESRVFHSTKPLQGEWRLNPRDELEGCVRDIPLCLNSEAGSRHPWDSYDALEALNKDIDNPWALYLYADHLFETHQIDEAEALFDSLCRKTVASDVDLNHAAACALIDCYLNKKEKQIKEPLVNLVSDEGRSTSSYLHRLGELYARRYEDGEDNDDYEMSMECYVKAVGAFKTRKLSRHLIGAGSLLTKSKIQKLYDLSRGFV